MIRLPSAVLGMAGSAVPGQGAGLLRGAHLAGVIGIAVAVAALAVVAGVVVRDRRRARDCADRPGAGSQMSNALAACTPRAGRRSG